MLCLVGCGGRRGAIRSGRRTLVTQEERARIHDIPFPLKVTPTKLLFTESRMVLSFRSECSEDELLEFFRTGMEYWGWDEQGQVQAPESCMMFSKPSKICSIMFRPEGSSIRIVIFTTTKKSSD